MKKSYFVSEILIFFACGGPPGKSHTIFVEKIVGAEKFLETKKSRKKHCSELLPLFLNCLHCLCIHVCVCDPVVSGVPVGARLAT